MDYTIDAKNKPLGRAASEAATILQGKKDPSYAPHKPGNDRVLVKNVDRIRLTGNKAKQKEYFRHTGYIGNIKATSFEKAFEESPEKVFEEAVRRMLPKNKLNKQRMRNLVFVESSKE